MARNQSIFTNLNPGAVAELLERIAHKGIWVEPELLTEVEDRAKSAEAKVRHPFFKGLREDLQ